MSETPSPPWTWTMALAAAMLTVAAMGCERDAGDGAQTTEAESRETATADDDESEQAAADEATRRLSDRFNTLMQDDGDPAPMVPEALRLTERYPDHAAAHRLLGQILLADGQHESAYAAFEKSLQLDPEQMELRLLAGTIATRDLEDLAAAQRHYAQAVSLEPTHGRARLHLAQALIDQQRYDEARHELLVALRHNAEMHEAHALLADLYAQQNKTDPALTHIRRALDLLPGDDELTDAQRQRRVIYIRRRAMLLRRSLKPEAALSVLRDLPTELHYTAGIAEEMARCWAMMQQPIKGAEHFEQAVERHPTRADVTVGAARWYLRAEAPADARRMIDHLQRINPRHPQLAELREQLAAAEGDGTQDG
ncbi:MAG: tetratricopeptide repeat protein [Phycisphaeraceae bacterium]